MLVVKQGHEPIGFTSWFPSWSADKAAQGKSFEQLKQELSAGAGMTSVDEVRTLEMHEDAIRSMIVPPSSTTVIVPPSSVAN